MDMFMDKLAQKLTAQEIIKANTAADTEEMNRLKNQVAEYNECLQKLQDLIEEAADKLQGASQVNGAEINRLVEESICKIKEIRQDNAALEQLSGQLEQLNAATEGKLEQLNAATEKKLDQFNAATEGKIEQLNATTEKRLEQLNAATEGKLEQINATTEKRLEQLNTTTEGKLEQLKAVTEEKLEQLLTKEPQGGLGEKFAAVEENVHKECVKVYRNVQAVVMEESGKQNEAVNEASEKVKSMGGKLSAVLGISVAALVFSLASVILQILSALGVGTF